MLGPLPPFMPAPSPSPAPSATVRRFKVRWLPPATLAGFVLAVCAVVLITFFTERATRTRSEAGARITETFSLLNQVQDVLAAVSAAEAANRGFLLTGEEAYLQPYEDAKVALPGMLAELRRALQDSPEQLRRAEQLVELIDLRLLYLAEGNELRRQGRMDAALAHIRSGRGKVVMDRVRTVGRELANLETQQLQERQSVWTATTRSSSTVTAVGAAILLALIVGAAVVSSRDYRARESEAWVRAGQMELAARLQDAPRLERVAERVLGLLAERLDAQVGAFHVRGEDGTLQRLAGHALPSDAARARMESGEGLAGEALRRNAILQVADVPRGYLPVTSAVGSGDPRELLVAPATADGTVQAVVELGFFRALKGPEVELARRCSEAVGAAVRAAKDRARLEALLEETQRQAEELQAQGEELRGANEELSEQERVLRESQARLEQQQAELEQTNDQLEEQTQLLEEQKAELVRAQVTLTEKAAELERVSRYKSEFLANMSHELRTPLNSSLILSRLLADNAAGNLDAEQVKFAQTIHAAGNDLLALINDILDLSRIEAGKLEVQAERVVVSRLVDGLAQSLRAIPQQKGLQFETEILAGTPERMETDPQRLGQILKNLLSNAFKFTERGSVSLRVAPSAGDRVSFAIRDTGIGIPSQQQDLIFEAFRQADGSTHRKYGGSGLGLSISRDLARLLGGDLTVQSAPGEGSTFTLTLPLQWTAPEARAGATTLTPSREPQVTAALAQTITHAPPATALPAALPSVPGPEVEDDRERLEPGDRCILVVEDDVKFAAILRDVARELGFRCVVTHSASGGLAAAARYKPDAILLDMNLPDHSGLGVLDQLKRTPELRHVPVHVVSVADYTQEALERGAVGYALKPVKREELLAAFAKLQLRFEQQGRRILVVEDDARQRESIGHLLANDGVEIVGASSGEEALGLLQRLTFDCMVMDLNLPDVSGFELLEQMAALEAVSFPPVIVYTGRALGRDEEQRLRRFSRSIIVKDARSPERLLDEVTLFLHQVESTLPPDRQRMLRLARDRDTALEGRTILVVEDDVRNVFALSSVLEPRGAKVQIARNGREAIERLSQSMQRGAEGVDLVLMDIMMPEMDGLTAMREIRGRTEFQKLPIIALTAKAMRDDQEACLGAGANDYIAKPLDVERLLSLVRVWMPK